MHERQFCPRGLPSPSVFFQISTHFTATLGIPPPSDILQSDSHKCSSQVKPGDFTSVLPNAVYNPKAFFPHAAWLDQGCPHCPKFPTAASRRSLDRVSVPVWLVVLSDQLLIVALVGLYPANQLISHRPLRSRQALRSPAFTLRSYAVLATLSGGCPPQTDTFRCITHPFATRHQRASSLCCRSTCMCKACRQRSI